MASGNVLAVFTAQQNEPPSSGYATPDTRNAILVLDFDAANIEGAVFRGLLPPSVYNGGGLTIDTYWMATSATSGDIKVGTAIERDNSANHDLDADAFATEQTATVTADATSGKLFKATTTHSSGANMDSAAAGDPIRLKVRRVASDAADTMTGDAELFMVVVKET
jgi:hypothetical protein